MSDTTEIERADEAPVDDARLAVVAQLRDQLGEDLLDTHLMPGVDLWVRVSADVWVEAHRRAKELEFAFFDFVSAIDWLPSPYGREMDSEVDTIVFGAEPKEPLPMTTGVAGGTSRFQMLSRVFNITTNIGINFKCDLDDATPTIDTLIGVYAGANWHERELWEMFGIEVTGHPDLRALYLPSHFEGNPLRKDFPLLARRVKPWPGIVDVEPMPGEASNDEEEASS